MVDALCVRKRGVRRAWPKAVAVGGEDWILETFDKEELAEFCDWLDIGLKEKKEA